MYALFKKIAALRFAETEAFANSCHLVAFSE